MSQSISFSRNSDLSSVELNLLADLRSELSGSLVPAVVWRARVAGQAAATAAINSSYILSMN